MADESKDSSPPSVVIVHSASKSTATVHLHGATLTSWTIGADNEQLFLSSKAVFDGATPIRGGIPLVFPQFGGGDLPSHGFARRSSWTLASQADGTATFVLEPNDKIRAMWDHDFRLEYTVVLEASSLTTTLTVHNTGSSEFKFQALQHTYLRTSDVSQVKIRGLHGYAYVDKLKPEGEPTETNEVITIGAETDRIYKDVSGTTVAVESITGAGTTMNVGASATMDGAAAANDVVVWNPWVDKAKRMADFGDEEYPGMLCIEPGRVSTWETLPAGKQWALKQTLCRL